MYVSDPLRTVKGHLKGEMPRTVSPAIDLHVPPSESEMSPRVVTLEAEPCAPLAWGHTLNECLHVAEADVRKVDGDCWHVLPSVVRVTEGDAAIPILLGLKTLAEGRQ